MGLSSGALLWGPPRGLSSGSGSPPSQRDLRRLLLVVADRDEGGEACIALERGVMEWGDIWVIERVDHLHPIVRVQPQHLNQQPEAIIAHSREAAAPPFEVLPRIEDFGALGHARVVEDGEHLLGVARDRAQPLLVRLAQQLEDRLALAEHRRAREDRLAYEHLPHNAADRPHVDAEGVRRATQQNLGRAIPSRRHVVRQLRVVRLGLRCALAQRARESKVCDLHDAVGVEEQVGRLHVAMEQLGGVHVFERLEHLPRHVLLVNVLQHVATDRREQVRLHALKDKVEVAVVVGLEHAEERDNVLVALHLLQEHDLAERALRVCRVLECIKDLLQCNRLAAPPVDGTPHDTVSALAQDPLGIIALEHVPVNVPIQIFVAHTLWQHAARPISARPRSPGMRSWVVSANGDS